MRRSIVTRRVLLVAMAACLLCCSGAQAKKPSNPGGGGGGDKDPSYQFIKLDTDDGAGGTLEGTAFDINDSRLVVGGVHVPSGQTTRFRAAYWTVTELSGAFATKLHFLDESSFARTSAYGCNEFGEIVGMADDALAVYWADTNAVVEELPAPLAVSNAEAINNRGVICGWSTTGFDVALDEMRALVWSFTNGQWRCLELAPLGDPGVGASGNPLPNRALAIAISDEDADSGLITIAGQSNGNAVAWTVVLDGSGGLLAGPAMILDAAAEATGVNNGGMVCGFGRLGPSSGGDGVVWIDGGPAQLLALDDSRTWNSPHSAFPVDVNDNGVIVGNNFVQAVMWPSKDASLIVLDDLLPKRKSPFDSLHSAYAVSESNEIVGSGGFEELNLPFLAVPK